MNMYQRIAFGVVPVLVIAYLADATMENAPAKVIGVAVLVALLTLKTTWKLVYALIQAIGSTIGFTGHVTGSVGDKLADAAYVRRQRLVTPRESKDRVPGWEEFQPTDPDDDRMPRSLQAMMS